MPTGYAGLLKSGDAEWFHYLSNETIPFRMDIAGSLDRRFLGNYVACPPIYYIGAFIAALFIMSNHYGKKMPVLSVVPTGTFFLFLILSPAVKCRAKVIPSLQDGKNYAALGEGAGGPGTASRLRDCNRRAY